jgi:hypothetical protein
LDGVIPANGNKRDENRLRPADRAAHDWYRFVLSFPPHLVRRYLHLFAAADDTVVLDPFYGTGTTLVECKKLGIPSAGVEAHPMARFASSVKVDWSVDPDALLLHAEKVAGICQERLLADGETLFTLCPEKESLLLKGSISPLPLHKTLTLLEILNGHLSKPFYGHERLALARALVYAISNLEFGPEVGVGPPKADAPVVQSWLNCVKSMAEDVKQLADRRDVPAKVLLGDARNLAHTFEPESVGAVITSPPYPNEKDYIRTTRLESVILGLIRTKQEIRALKQDLVRSNTRGVYKADRDDVVVTEHDGIQEIAEAIEQRRVALGKTSGFERLYPRVTRLYFGGMYRHLASLRHALRPGASLAYVVGDQASYLRVKIATGQILAELAESLGYQVSAIDLFRTRLATATGEMLREEVLVLKWPGGTRTARGTEMSQSNRYTAIIQRIFEEKYVPGMREVDFVRDDIVRVARELGIELPKNLGDVIYSFRYRTALPESIQSTGGGDVWVIRPAGRAKYRFALVADRPIVPNPNMVATKIPDATPGLVSKYALTDEQALLARLRYNRLTGIFTGLTMLLASEPSSQLHRGDRTG